MSVTSADIKALPSGEFASVLDATVDIYITEAQSRIHQTTWGDQYDLGVKYLTAHALALDMGGAHGAAGPVASESAGPVSRSYAAYSIFGSTGGDNLNATAYGRKFQMLRKELCIFGVVA